MSATTPTISIERRSHDGPSFMLLRCSLGDPVSYVSLFVASPGLGEASFIPINAIQMRHTALEHDSLVVEPGRNASGGSLNRDDSGRLSGLNPSVGSRLPPELIITVFEALVDPSNRARPDSCALEASALIRASQVCRGWRQAALGTPVLWGQVIQIDRDSPDRFKALVDRLGDNPFSISSSYPVLSPGESGTRVDEIAAHWDWVLTHFDRCTSFYVRLGNAPFWNPNMFRHALTRPAPLLESFTVISMSDFYIGCPPFAGTEILFASQAPKLRTLQLRVLSPVLPPYLLFNLSRHSSMTCLVVDTRRSPVSERVQEELSSVGWVRILQQLPLLTRLVLHAAVFDTFGGDPQGLGGAGAPCQLHNLQLFKLVGHIHSCFSLTRSIAFPPSCIIRISAVPNGNLPTIPFDGIFALLSSLLGSQALIGDSMTIGTMEGAQLVLDNGGACTFEFHLQWKPDAEYYRFEASSWMQFFQTLANATRSNFGMVLRTVKSLTVRLDGSSENSRLDTSLDAIFEHFINVEDVHLHGLSSSILQRLYSHRHAWTSQGCPCLQYFLPAVSRIFVAAPAFSESTSRIDGWMNGYQALALALALRAAVPENRRVQGVIVVNGDGRLWDVDIVKDAELEIFGDYGCLQDREIGLTYVVTKGVAEVYPLRRERVVWTLESPIAGTDIAIENNEEALVGRVMY
ncbi:hypothetical protein DFP72DRAFT_862767 [Ephemerocybe angulata]|uniref:F-box domain-containing protein n=1 Tax=Ephemerocybe angulata TaxID=980116 RepID=A0A8H6H832_9AGAR|nr:hypothetical protein DFP72DRAFT_862767 [Tulosesus angulatus]